MKAGIHPEYRLVVFQDSGTKKQFIVGSTVTSHETVTIGKETYPLVLVDISSDSHPFYTGVSTLVDTAGQVDRFKKRMSKKVEISEQSEIDKAKPKAAAPKKPAISKGKQKRGKVETVKPKKAA